MKHYFATTTFMFKSIFCDNIQDLLFAYCPHTVRNILSSYCPHTVRILSAFCPHTIHIQAFHKLPATVHNIRITELKKGEMFSKS